MFNSFGGVGASRDRKPWSVGPRALWQVACGCSILLIAACDDHSGCVNEELDRLASPDGIRDAVVFVRACGATTGPGLNVSVIQRGDSLPDEPGNVLVIRDPAAMAAKRGDIATRWVAPRQLHLTYEASRTVSRSADEQNGVRIVHDRR